MEVGKDTKFSLTIETAISIVVTLGMVIGMWFTLKADIEEAKELPVPEVGRTEYDLKDQMIRNTIIETQKDVTEMKEEQKEMRDDVKKYRTYDDATKLMRKHYDKDILITMLIAGWLFFGISSLLYGQSTLKSLQEVQFLSQNHVVVIQV